MALIKYTENELNTLARLMRAEAVGEGDLGMLMVGNVVINRVIADCYTFKNITTLNDAIYQTPGGFSGIKSNLFYNSPTTKEKELALRVIKGEYYFPATNALWFYAPGNNTNCVSYWYNQKNVGRYKTHCFYEPDKGVCPTIR